MESLRHFLNRILGRVVRRLVKDGLLIPDQNQPWLDLSDTDTLDAISAASTRYRIAIGPGAGGRTLTLKSTNCNVRTPNRNPLRWTETVSH